MSWTDPPPSRVTLFPPSMTMCTGVLPVDIGGLSVDVTTMVTALGPQLSVTVPPPLTALDSASNVQLNGVPVPTTAVGRLVSTGCASAGNVNVVQDPIGFPATGNAPRDPVPLEVPLEAPASVALPELAPPLVEPEPAPPLLEPPLFEPLPLTPALDPLPVDPALDPLVPDPVSLNWAPLDADEAPALLPESPFASEPVLLPQPIPSATQRDNESRVRSVRTAILASKELPSSLRHMRAASALVAPRKSASTCSHV